MNEIIFKDLKQISKSLDKKNYSVFVDYLNSFEGKNIFEKFKNILQCWESDVSPSLNLTLDEKLVKISLSYIISELYLKNESKITIIEDNLEVVIDIPEVFDISKIETLPIYSLIQYINISGISIDLLKLSINDKINIIDNLPAKSYTRIYKEISGNKSKLLEFSNSLMENFKFNLLTNDVYLFLESLFLNFESDYFKDVIYHLSNKIDGEILMSSTPLELEYYIQKYSEESNVRNEALTI